MNQMLATGYTWKPLERAQVAFLGKKHLSVVVSTRKASRSLDSFSRLGAIADALMFLSGRSQLWHLQVLACWFLSVLFQ